ncbi:hypothetical protein C8J57DRAFT_1620373 [Mycena rebaudengoi]|nr:hypothetical protein C8J57DRAFT_1620373 [Mycena rebaudengoi]
MVAQMLLQSLEADKQVKRTVWFMVENSMIIALVHAGDLEPAHVHRMRILELGGVMRIAQDTRPAFDTMMQLYTTIKPNHERAVFYRQLRDANIAPTAYTYKLLMNAYDRVEPVDILRSGLRREDTCVQKDLNEAIEVFQSIQHIPRTRPRDALVFEAMINSLVAHRWTDLMPENVVMMASEGRIAIWTRWQARSILEGLVDPPSGIAALNNHAPHEPTSSLVIDFMEPVYREPSMWGVLVRAELGSGNRDNATLLLDSLRARYYPEAVYNRISGILIDHTSVV